MQDAANLQDWNLNVAPKIAKPDLHNQEAQLTDPTQSGVFEYSITSLPADFQSPSATCGNWLGSQPPAGLCARPFNHRRSVFIVHWLAMLSNSL